MSFNMSYGAASVPAPANLSSNDPAWFSNLFAMVFGQHNALAAAALVKDANSGVGGLTYVGLAPTGSFTGVAVQGAGGYTGTPFSYGKAGQAAVATINNDASLTAFAFHGPADSAAALTTAGAANQVLLNNGAAWVAGAVTGAMFAQGTITPDKLGGLWYTASATAMKVHVAPGTVWPGGSPIFFTGGDSPAISTAGIASGQARIDLLYIDGSGAQQWQLGTPAAAASAGLPTDPTGVFSPVEYHKTYFGATAITGYTDLGHDSYFYQDARSPISPKASSTIAAHSLPFTRMLDGSVAQASPASTTVNVGAISYFNSAGILQDYAGGALTFATGSMPVTNPRWDMLYLDDSKNLTTAAGTEAVTPTKPTRANGRYTLAYVYLPVGCISIVDEANWTGAALQGYIHFAPGYFSTVNPSTPVTTATGTVTVSGGAVTSVAVGVGGGPYTTPPSAIIGGTGTGAIVTPVLTAGAVTSYVVNAGGSGYANGTGTTPITVTSSGGIQPLALGGTGGTTQATARSGIGAAASGLNADITGVTALTAVTGSVSFSGQQTFNAPDATHVPLIANGFAGQTADLQEWYLNGTLVGNVAPAGSLGLGGLVGANTRLLLAGTLAGTLASVNGLNQTMTLKPLGGGGAAVWSNIANGGALDMGAVTAVGANVAAAYGVLANGFGRSNFVSYGDVYAILSLNPSAAITAGTYTLTDRAGNVTPSIAFNAPIGTDTVTSGTINYALAHATPAAINYWASGSIPSSGGNTGFTALLPGTDNAFTVTPTGITGGTLSTSVAAQGKPGITSAYGVYAARPTGGVNNYNFYGTGSLASPGGPFAGSANEYLMRLDGTVPVTGSANGYQKNGIGVYMTDNDGTGGGSVEHDVVAGDFQTWINDGVSNGNVWALHLQTNVGLLATTATGTTILIEGQVINNATTDDGNLQNGHRNHQVGINMVAQGPQNVTTAYAIGASAGYWHQGVYATNTAIGSVLTTDSFLEMTNEWVVRRGGLTTIGGTTTNSAWLLDVLATATAGGIRAVGNSAPTTDLALFDASASTNALKSGIDKFGHHYKTQAAVPTAAGGAGAGTAPTFAFASGSTDHDGQIQITIGSSPTAGVQTVATVTHKTAMTNAPHRITLTPANSGAAGVMGTCYASAVGATTWTITTLATLTAAGVYWWWYSIE